MASELSQKISLAAAYACCAGFVLVVVIGVVSAIPASSGHGVVPPPQTGTGPVEPPPPPPPSEPEESFEDRLSDVLREYMTLAQVEEEIGEPEKRVSLSRVGDRERSVYRWEMKEGEVEVTFLNDELMEWTYEEYASPSPTESPSASPTQSPPDQSQTNP
ncbi:MAG: hypothetical protein R6V12_06655 [Candidatus Hydrogenedentota bacterium]